MIGSRFVWVGMRKDIATLARSCITCQQSKIHRYNKTPVQRFMDPDESFSSAHLDLIGPMPESNGYAYCLTAIYRFTRHLECIPLKDITRSHALMRLY